jgi:Predicted NADH:ubiquinone oxidoreductase, subunit RnfG
MKPIVKEIARPALVLFLICLVVTLLLAVTNRITRGQIEKMDRESESASRQLVLPEATSFEDSADRTYAVGKAGNDVVGYVFVTKSKSYGGDLSAMTGIGRDGKVAGVSILSSNDTPGLGLNAQKESFRGQYRQAAPENGFEVVKSGTAKDGQIEAVTGATITSKAVTDCVNQAVARYQKIKDGE